MASIQPMACHHIHMVKTVATKSRQDHSVFPLPNVSLSPSKILERLTQTFGNASAVPPRGHTRSTPVTMATHPRNDPRPSPLQLVGLGARCVYFLLYH